jgi:hypothetical protein
MRWGALRGFRGLAGRPDLAGGRRAVCREGRPGRRGGARESRGLCRGCGEWSHDHRMGGPQRWRRCSYVHCGHRSPWRSAHLYLYLCGLRPGDLSRGYRPTARHRWDGGDVNSKRLFGVAEREPPSWPSPPLRGLLLVCGAVASELCRSGLCGRRPGPPVGWAPGGAVCPWCGKPPKLPRLFSRPAGRIVCAA